MKKTVWVLIILLVLGGVGFSFYKFSKNASLTSSEPLVTEEESESVPEVSAPDIKKVDSTSNTFYHKEYGLSFVYPSRFKVSNFREGDGEQILFQGQADEWFQIYVTPWDEEGDITSGRIKQDLPDTVITSPQNVVLGPKQKQGIGPHAFIFFSKDGSLGDTREVWFVQSGNLFQITTFKKSDTLLGEILTTLEFKE